MARKLFTAIALMMCGTALTGIPAEAQVAWFGWSDLCFEGKLKTGSVTEGEFTVEVTGVIRVLCDNQQSSENKCQFGTGHSGTAVVTVPALADPTKEKGFIYFNGCIPGAKWDVHFDNEGQVVAGHEHLCVNDNTIEIVDTAHMPRIDTKWFLTSKGKTTQHGNQTCLWLGAADLETCSITHDEAYDCVIDEVFKK